MTKPITAVGVMILHEEGHFQLNDPVAKYLPELAKLEVRDGSANPATGEVVRKLGQVPLRYEPGTRWHYSVAVDVQGRLIEVVSGQSLDRFFRERIFEPLGMKDTFSGALGSVGEYNWGGAAGTRFWVDPEEELIGIYMIQILPHTGYGTEFRTFTYQAIAD